MLVTRPEPDVHDSIARLRAIGIDGVALSMLERAVLHTSLPDPKGFAALALTSANALRTLEARGALLPYLKLKVFAVGEKSAAAARLLGFGDVVAAGGTLGHLVEAIGVARLSGPVFYPTARHQSGDLAKALAPAGVMVVTSRVYEMRAATSLPPEIVRALQGNQFAGALFYSRRTAETFAALAAEPLGRDGCARLAVLCLSEQVAEPLMAAHFVRIGLADYPTEDAMMAMALSFARAENRS